MKVLIISSTCSGKKYKEICDRRIIKSLDTNQKFFSSLIYGIKENGYRNITCISVLPVSYGTYPDKVIKQSTEIDDGTKYIYCKTLNYPVIRNIYASFQVKKLVRQYIECNKEEDLVIIADGLYFEFSKACRYIRNRSKKVFSIVTDIPDFVSNTGNSKSIKSWLLKRYGNLATNRIRNDYDGYIFLTEYMAEICNIKKRPYIVVEGMLSEHQRIEKKNKSYESLPLVLYAGKYNREFGTVLLAESAPYLKGICNIVMYGAGGDCFEQLMKISSENDNLEVNNIIPLEELLIKETEADLLINPRPANQVFTKYSFPSKTLEYLDSGTPVLMYRLEGIPKEYDKYLYYINGITPEDLAKSILQVLSEGSLKLSTKGLEGQHFVRENKNCTVQSRKILDFVEHYLRNH